MKNLIDTVTAWFPESTTKVLNERITSPFYGSFVISWIVCNWKPIYATFFVDQNLLNRVITNKDGTIKFYTKVDYLLSFYTGGSLWHPLSHPWDYFHLLLCPLLAATLIYPLLQLTSNLPFYLDGQVWSWRVRIQNKIEGNTQATNLMVRKVREGANALEARADEEFRKRLRAESELNDISMQKKILEEKLRSLELVPTSENDKQLIDQNLNLGAAHISEFKDFADKASRKLSIPPGRRIVYWESIGFFKRLSLDDKDNSQYELTYLGIAFLQKIITSNA